MKSHASRTGICVVVTTIGLALGVAGCDQANPASPSMLSPAGSPAATAATPTSGAADATFAVGPELASVRAATAAFHDLKAANAAGYTIENEPCVASPEGAMGIHALNFELLGDQALDPARPELLLYEPRSNGGHRLVGVEYFEVTLLRNPATGVVAPWIDPGPWPSNYEVVTPTPQLFGHTFDGPMPGHTPTMPWHWDMHVWIWANNPSGMFAEWNPTVHCGE